MQNNERAEFSATCEKLFPFWNTLESHDRDILCDATRAVTYEKGQNIHGGEDCTGVIIVRTGELRVYMLSEDGKEVTLYRLFEGDMCMLSASCVIKAVTFDVFVDAEADSYCYIINPHTFGEISERIPQIEIFTLKTAVGRFSDVMWVIQQILFMNFDRRLAIFLSDEVLKTDDGVIRLTHEQIAKYIGSAREVVSRMLKYFSTEGIVEYSRAGIKIIDKQKLRRIAL